MKRILLSIGTIAMLAACNREPSRIVSDKPVDNVIMGAVLCESVSEADVLRAFDQAGMRELASEKYSYNTDDHLMIVPPSDDGISYAGCTWDYADFCKNESGILYAVVFENFYDTKAQAEDQYKKVAGLLEAKHGKENISKSTNSFTSMWTDDINSVGVSYHKDGTMKDGWTCTFYYVNRELYNK